MSNAPAQNRRSPDETLPAPADASHDLPPLPPTPLGRYRHRKGGLYEVVGVARHSETLEPMVVYRSLQGAMGLWVRPHAMFFERVVVDGREVPRFAPIDDRSPLSDPG
jgi:hypothetical protein